MLVHLGLGIHTKSKQLYDISGLLVPDGADGQVSADRSVWAREIKATYESKWGSHRLQDRMHILDFVFGTEGISLDIQEQERMRAGPRLLEAVAARQHMMTSFLEEKDDKLRRMVKQISRLQVDKQLLADTGLGMVMGDPAVQDQAGAVVRQTTVQTLERWKKLEGQPTAGLTMGSRKRRWAGQMKTQEFADVVKQWQHTLVRVVDKVDQIADFHVEVARQASMLSLKSLKQCQGLCLEDAQHFYKSSMAAALWTRVLEAANQPAEPISGQAVGAQALLESLTAQQVNNAETLVAQQHVTVGVQSSSCQIRWWNS